MVAKQPTPDRIRIALTRFAKGHDAKYANIILYDGIDLLDILSALNTKVKDLRKSTADTDKTIALEPAPKPIRPIPTSIESQQENKDDKPDLICTICGNRYKYVTNKNQPNKCPICALLTS